MDEIGKLSLLTQLVHHVMIRDHGFLIRATLFVELMFREEVDRLLIM
jgi:hypothetical protein